MQVFFLLADLHDVEVHDHVGIDAAADDQDRTLELLELLDHTNKGLKHFCFTDSVHPPRHFIENKKRALLGN